VNPADHHLFAEHPTADRRSEAYEPAPASGEPAARARVAAAKTSHPSQLRHELADWDYRDPACIWLG